MDELIIPDVDPYMSIGAAGIKEDEIAFPQFAPIHSHAYLGLLIRRAGQMDIEDLVNTTDKGGTVETSQGISPKTIGCSQEALYHFYEQ